MPTAARAATFAAALAVAIVAARAAPAAAQHCHIDVPTRVSARAPARAWWARVATVFTAGAGHVRDATSDFDDVTRAYQGAALVVAAGWSRVGARVTLGGSRVADHGVGVDDARAAVSVELTPRRDGIRAGLSAAGAVPTGDADAGRGMGHVMLAGGFWSRVPVGRAVFESSIGYARALGDGAEHAAHLHGSELWPLVDPMNAAEVVVDSNATLAIVPERLSVRGGVVGAVPVGRGASRVVTVAALQAEHGPFGATASIAMPVVGDPFVARGQLELGYRF